MLDYKICFSVQGADIPPIFSEFETPEECMEWAQDYGAKLPGFVGFTCSVVGGIDPRNDVHRAVLSAKWRGMTQKQKRIMIRHAQHAAGEMACVLDNVARGIARGYDYLAWLVYFRPVDGWEWEKFES